MPKVKVSSRPERFWRAGLEFTREPRVVEVDEKTLARLKAEPMLVVEEARDKENAGPEGDGKGKRAKG